MGLYYSTNQLTILFPYEYSKKLICLDGKKTSDSPLNSGINLCFRSFLRMRVFSSRLRARRQDQQVLVPNLQPRARICSIILKIQ